MLFGKGREDEVFVRYWQKAPLRLRSLGDALAPERAGADGDLGLDHLISGSFRILTGVQKTNYPLSLIVLQHKPITDRSSQSNRHYSNHRVLPTEAHQENTGRQDGKESQDGTQVRLEHDHHHRQTNQAPQLEQIV